MKTAKTFTMHGAGWNAEAITSKHGEDGLPVARSRDEFLNDPQQAHHFEQYAEPHRKRMLGEVYDHAAELQAKAKPAEPVKEPEMKQEKPEKPEGSKK